MLDTYFNFTKKSNLVGNLKYDFFNWRWLTFLGHPVYCGWTYSDGVRLIILLYTIVFIVVNIMQHITHARKQYTE